MKDLDFTVIVPTHNRSERLTRTLGSIEAQTLRPDQYEIVVVANNCTDDTVTVVEQRSAHSRCALRVTEETKVGPSAARNRGIREARARWCAFIDDDMTVAPGWLAAFAGVLAPHGDSHPAIACGRNDVVFVGGRPPWLADPILDLFGGIYHPPTARRIRYPSIVPSGNFACHRALFSLVGFFDERFSRADAEDAELSYRVMYRGIPAYWVHDALAYHYVDTDRLTREQVRARAEEFGGVRPVLFAGVPSRLARTGWQALDIALFGAAYVRALVMQHGSRLAGRPDLEFAYQCKRSYGEGYLRALLGREPADPRAPP
ncbi:MAG: glycosyltransferase family 2 protein [Deltaproteobacteria bacterium]|nr:glycosyltransferase family 2 protein [Deltaproteobacteria bacterium]